jgi:SulP family sulfate permease
MTREMPRQVVRAVPSILAGMLAGVLTALFEVSYASLIFAGDLAPFVSRGISIMLLGSAISLAVSAIFNLMPGSALVPQDTPVAIMAAMAASVVAATAGPMPSDQAFHTVIATMMVTTFAAAVAFLLVARLRLARFIRIIPYPVVGGFLAGVGWLMVSGAVTMMAGFRPDAGQIALFVSPPVLLKWLPGLGFGIVTLLLSRRTRHAMVVPAAVLAGVAIFYGVLAATGTSVSDAAAQGWLIGRFRRQRLWLPLSLHLLEATQWSVVLDQADTMLAAVLVSVLASVLNLGGIETLTGHSSDGTRELTAVSAANLGSFLVGSPIAYHSVSYAGFVTRMNAGGRLAALVGSLVCAAAALFGMSALSLFPKAVLGGTIVVIGAGFLMDVLYDGWRRLDRSDYAVGVGMLIVVAVFGLLPAVGVGLVASVVIFAVNYARTDVIYQEATGSELGSNVERSARQNQVLRDTGEQIRVLKLRGLIFFGTAYSIFEGIQRRLEDASRPRIRFLVIDFRRVRGLDASAEMVFQRILSFAQTQQCFVLLSSLSPSIERQLHARIGTDAADSGALSFRDLDHALEWCENRILTSFGLNTQGGRRSIRELLERLLDRSDLAERLAPYLDRHEIDTGQKLIAEGDEADRVYIVLSGEFGVFLDQDERLPTRLRTMREGAVFGEAEIYLDRPRSATIFALQRAVCYSLSAATLAALEEDDPELALAFQRLMVRLLSQRLIDLNRTVRSLSE